MEELLWKCDVHNDQKLNMFCQDHRKLCCSACVQLNHSQCTNVALISESVNKKSVDMQQLSIDPQTIIDELNMFKSTQESSIQFVEESYSEKLQEIRDMRDRLNAYLDKIEKTTLKTLGEIRTTLQTSLKKDVDNCSRLKNELQLLGEAVRGKRRGKRGREGKKSKKEIKFIASIKCRDKIQEAETYLMENSVKVHSSMIFLANIDIEQYLSETSALGKIVVMKPNQVMTVKKNAKYNVEISGDRRDYCLIRGICSLPSGHVILVDEDNKKVKLLDQQYSVVSHCDIPGYVRDICLITTSEVAVTAVSTESVGNNVSLVQFISVLNGQLINGRRFQLKHDANIPSGIAHHHGALYVTSGSALYHYTLAGTLVKKLYEDTGFGNTVVKFAISPAGDRIYVITNALLTLAMDGTLISTFIDPELQCVQGIYVTPAGHLLVWGCISYFGSSSAVIQVDREGKGKLATLVSQSDEINNLMSVCCNSKMDQLIVGREHDNSILVMELQFNM
ncbi:hypothetical protein DPMN_066653 [Dreissena polymorpha]|uniref:B box-type domain-containing protein n=2 Tax=Dreissena polymorpha TaxID=45954 RepID=A0A9D4BSZ5_DREPO|nr:hypothetical protein DPMN_066653 [Dreissena polymorpha]